MRARVKKFKAVCPLCGRVRTAYRAADGACKGCVEGAPVRAQRNRADGRAELAASKSGLQLLTCHDAAEAERERARRVLVYASMDGAKVEGPDGRRCLRYDLVRRWRYQPSEGEVDAVLAAMRGVKGERWRSEHSRRKRAAEDEGDD